SAGEQDRRATQGGQDETPLQRSPHRCFPSTADRSMGPRRLPLRNARVCATLGALRGTGIGLWTDPSVVRVLLTIPPSPPSMWVLCAAEGERRPRVSTAVVAAARQVIPSPS